MTCDNAIFSLKNQIEYYGKQFAVFTFAL